MDTLAWMPVHTWMPGHVVLPNVWVFPRDAQRDRKKEVIGKGALQRSQEIGLQCEETCIGVSTRRSSWAPYHIHVWTFTLLLLP